MRQQSWSKNGYYMIYLFMIGLFIGILVVNAGHDTWIVDSDLLGTEMILRLKNSIPEGEGLFGYVLKHRLFTLWMLALLSTTCDLCLYLLYGTFGRLSFVRGGHPLRHPGHFVCGGGFAAPGFLSGAGLHRPLYLGGQYQQDVVCAEDISGWV